MLFHVTGSEGHVIYGVHPFTWQFQQVAFSISANIIIFIISLVLKTLCSVRVLNGALIFIARTFKGCGTWT